MHGELPSGEVSLLLTDIEGSTRLLHRLGPQRYAQALQQHRALLRDAFQAHGGVEVDTEGDAFFVAFADAPSSLRAAISGQRALAGHDWSQTGEVKVRMGIHSGTPERTEEGYVGEDVFEALRLASAGHGGQILISERTAARIGDSAVAEARFDDLGEHRFQDVEGPRRVFQVVVDDMPSDFPPPNTLKARPNNLPRAATEFIGRDELVAEVTDLVLRDDVRLVTLTGPGGTGKSRLGLRVATDLLGRFEDGVFFVGLAPVRDPALVLASIAAAFDIREGQSQSLEDSLCAHLADKDLLLLIDNFEQVQSASSVLGTILSRCPRLRVLVTSREPVDVVGGHGFPVPPLALPLPGRRHRVEDALGYEAVKLFVDRAHAANPQFQLEPSNLESVLEICRRVDGLPLAIELAAARIATMSADALAEALDDRLAVLDSGGDEVLDHQRTLRDLIAWSYDMLDEHERLLWRRLGVFVGGASMDAAQSVCDLDDDLDVELDVESLVDKSLVGLEFPRVTADSAGFAGSDEPRLTLLETLREFAFEKLGESGEMDVLQARHTHWCLELAQRAAQELRGPDQDSWALLIDRDHPNIRSALAWSLDGRNYDVARQFGSALWFYWFHRGLISEGRRWLERSVADDAEHDALSASALLGLSNLDRHQNLLDDAQRNGELALAISREIDDREGIADALAQLGAIAQHQGDFERSESVLDEAVDILREIGSRERLSFTLNLLGALKQLNDDLETAAALYGESIEIAHHLDDHAKVAHASINLGEVKQLQGQLAEARALYLNSLTIYSQAGLKLAIAYAMEVLAGIETRLGRAENSALLFGAADLIREEISSPIEPFNKDRYDEDLSLTKDALSAASFESIWSDARNLEPADIIERIEAAGRLPR